MSTLFVRQGEERSASIAQGRRGPRDTIDAMGLYGAKRQSCKNIEEDEERNETIIGIDRKNEWVRAIVTKKTGLNPYALKAFEKEIENSGFSRVTI